MIVFRQLLLALNVLLACVFAVDYFVIESPKAKPRAKAKLGVLLGVLFFAFLALLLVFAVLGAATERDLRHLALLVFVIIPFAIGKLVSYRTLRFYAILQELFLLLSAVALFVV